MNYKLGIDLSTTNTGIVVLDENNNVVFIDVLTFRTYSEANMDYNIGLIDKMCKKIFSTVVKIDEIGIELSNFKNALITNRFNIYCGAFLAYLRNYIDIARVKTFNSQRWQAFVGIKVGFDTREITKQKSREFAKKHCKEYDDNWSDDICDAYCIAYFLSKIQSTEQKNIEIKNKKSKYIKKVQEKNRDLKLIENRVFKIQKLDKIKNKKLIERLEREIMEIKSKWE